jgi:signal transduction histidine kinase
MNRNGHGLGLSICNKIAKAMDGTLEVTSQLGLGSNFTFKLKTHVLNEHIVK